MGAWLSHQTWRARAARAPRHDRPKQNLGEDTGHNTLCWLLGGTPGPFGTTLFPRRPLRPDLRCGRADRALGPGCEAAPE
ncbi:hypothetical protein NDU88_002455 [Pleurodeles waltl]|uniref:Uncharacterized protein n=1 Tax=Pleurodeles waltl TaxID=8319 RepID=A0AAV7RDU3_PLEWA|nr:hypothetical protein NDU88_002455 [Pleurodeles waltl]